MALTRVKPLPVPKLRILRDPGVAGNTTLGGGINAPTGLGSGILQDPGVTGQVLGAPGVIPTSYESVPLDPNYSGGGTTDGGGGTTAPPILPGINLPDFMSALQADPAYKRAFDVYNTTLQGGRNSLLSRIRQAVIGSGFVPDMGGELSQYSEALDQDTLAAARGNTMSQKGLLDRQLAQNQAGLDYSLAARGTGAAGRGGALSVGLQQLGQQYDVASYQGMQNLLGALGQNVGSYNDLATSALSQREAAISDATGRLSNLYGGGVYDQGNLISNDSLSAYLKAIGYQGF